MGLRCGLIPKPSGARGKRVKKLIDLVSDDYKSTVAVDAILTGTGRLPNIEELNLEAAGVDCDATGVRFNDFLQTSNPRIYAAGDACLEHQFTHTAKALSRRRPRNSAFMNHDAGGRVRSTGELMLQASASPAA